MPSAEIYWHNRPEAAGRLIERKQEYSNSRTPSQNKHGDQRILKTSAQLAKPHNAKQAIVIDECGRCRGYDPLMGELSNELASPRLANKPFTVLFARDGFGLRLAKQFVQRVTRKR